MKGKGLIGENLELAYQTWRKCGRSPSLTIKTLNDEHGFSVSRPTLDQWKDEGDWVGRADRAEAQEKKANDPNLSGEEKMIAALVSQQQRYENYFETLPVDKIDPQMTYAYTNLITTVQNIRQKTSAYKADMFVGFMKELINWLSKNDPEAVKAIERNLDDFISFARDTYGYR